MHIVCPGPSVPLLGQQGSQGCILDSPGESGLVLRGKKDSALLSSRDGYLLEPTAWRKGSEASYGVWRDDSGLFSWPCRKKGPHLAMTGASRGFSPAAAPVSDFSRGTTGSSESLSCGARDVRSPCVWWRGVRDCSRVIVGESGLKTHWRRTLEVFLGLQQGTLGSLDLCRWPQATSKGASEKSGTLWIWEGPFVTQLGLVQSKRASSRMEAGTSGVLSISDSGRRVPAEYGLILFTLSNKPWIFLLK